MSFECEICDRYCNQWELAMCEYDGCNNRINCKCGHGNFCIDCIKNDTIEKNTLKKRYCVINDRIFCNKKCHENYDNSDSDTD